MWTEDNAVDPIKDHDDSCDSEYSYSTWSDDSINASGLDILGNDDDDKEGLSIRTPTDDESPYGFVPLADFSEIEIETTEYIASWLKMVTDPNKEIVEKMEYDIEDS